MHLFNILTLPMLEIFDICEGILTTKVNGRVEVLAEKPFLYLNTLGQLGGEMIHIDKYIMFHEYMLFSFISVFTTDSTGSGYQLTDY